MVLVVDAQIHIPWQELRFTFSRSSGPGGQNVNKVNTKVTLHWNVTDSTRLPDGVRDRFLKHYRSRINADGEIVVYSQRYRDQLRNRQDCLDKLRQLILSVRRAPAQRRRTRPSRASRERRLRDKRQLSEKKQRRRRPANWD
jgi:ribosome-associated protein